MARFLVIDDDNSIRHLITATLENAGHSVAAAATGSEGAALFYQQRPDVVITDVVMPEDSIETVIALSQRHPGVPIILMSGSTTSPNCLAVAKALGARRVMPKPFRLPDFLGAIDQVLAELNVPPPAAKKKT